MGNLSNIIDDLDQQKILTDSLSNNLNCQRKSIKLLDNLNTKKHKYAQAFGTWNRLDTFLHNFGSNHRQKCHKQLKLIDLDILRHKFVLSCLRKELEIKGIEWHIIEYQDFSKIHKSSDSKDMKIHMFLYFYPPIMERDI